MSKQVLTNLFAFMDGLADRLGADRSPRPEPKPRKRHVRLQIPDVEAIRMRAARGESRKVLAEQFGTTVSNVRSIVTRQTFKDVGPF